MKSRTSHVLAIACGSLLLLGQSIFAQSASEARGSTDGTQAKGQTEEPGGPLIIPHRTNPQEAEPTAGSTGVQTPDITYHGGAVLGSPNVYLIWYGNWNQSNGSDTPAGQQIVRD